MSLSYHEDIASVDLSDWEEFGVGQGRVTKEPEWKEKKLTCDVQYC